MADYTTVREEALKVLQAQEITESRLKTLCKFLHEILPDYDWVGFYWNHPEKPRTLKLGAFAGAPTEHVEIPFGKGICGQVAESNEFYITGDVTKEANYIACSVETRSEIVYPIRRNGTFIGQLDIDSHTPDAFDQQDVELLEAVCAYIGDNYLPFEDED